MWSQYVLKLCIHFYEITPSLTGILPYVNGYGYLLLPEVDPQRLEEELWAVVEALGVGTFLTWYEHEGDETGLIRHHGREHYMEWRPSLPGLSGGFPVMDLGGLRFMVRRPQDLHVARAMVGVCTAFSLMSLTVEHKAVMEQLEHPPTTPATAMDALPRAVANFMRLDPVVRACYVAIVGHHFGVRAPAVAEPAVPIAPLSLRGLVQQVDALRRMLPGTFIWFARTCLNGCRDSAVIAAMQSRSGLRELVEFTWSVVERCIWQIDFLLEHTPDERAALTARVSTLRAQISERAAELDMRLPQDAEECAAAFRRLCIVHELGFLARNHNFLRARIEPAQSRPDQGRI